MVPISGFENDKSLDREGKHKGVRCSFPFLFSVVYGSKAYSEAPNTVGQNLQKVFRISLYRALGSSFEGVIFI